MILVIMMLSFILPAVELTTKEPTQLGASLLTIEDLIMMQSIQTENAEVTSQIPSITWYQAVVIIYWIGMLFFLLRNVWAILQIVRIIKSGKKTKDENGIVIITHNANIPPFSWFKYIVISQKDLDEGGKEILIHEKAHIKNHHSFDIIIADLCIFLQCYNPATWLLKQELQNIHEYEADESVIAHGIDAKRYQILLIKKAIGPRFYSISNSFNHSSLKIRITMMLKKKSNPWARMKYLYILPVAALSVTAFARPELNGKLEKLADVNIEDVSTAIAENSAELENKIVNQSSIDTSKIKEVTILDEKTPMTFKGIISDDNGKGLAGVRIIDETLNTNAVTNSKGYFDIKINVGDIIFATYKGKQPLRIRTKLSMKSKSNAFMMYDEIKETGSKNVDNGNDNTSMKEMQINGEIFQVVDEMPEFQGGMREALEYLKKNIHYPEEAKKKGIQGRVIVQFVIDKEGNVINPKIVRSISPELDAEALRVIKGMPKWTPGKQRGKAVYVKFTLPVTFSLGNQNLEQTIKGDFNPKDLRLILVDGKEITLDEMNSIDTKKIESITVIKKEEDLKKYGEKGKNGVILINLIKK